MNAAVLLAGAIALTGSLEHDPLQVPTELESHVRLHTEPVASGALHWLVPATGSDCSPGVRTYPTWATMTVQVTEPATGLPIADGDGTTSIETGTHPATLCHGPASVRSIVWTGDSREDLGDPVWAEDVEFAWSLPDGAAEALIHAGQLESELIADAELRTQPSLNAPVTGVTIPAGSPVVMSLAIEDLDGGMGWVALTGADGATGFAPHWTVHPDIAGWGGPEEDTEPTPEESVETPVPEPSETFSEPPHSDQDMTTETTAPTTDTGDATPPEQTDEGAFPWPWAVGGLGLLVLGAAGGTALTRRAINNDNNNNKEKN